MINKFRQRRCISFMIVLCVVINFCLKVCFYKVQLLVFVYIISWIFIKISKMYTHLYLFVSIIKFQHIILYTER